MHEYLVLNALCPIGGKARACLRSESVYRLAQSDCADGHKILLIPAGGVVLEDDMGNEAQVVQDQFLPCLLASDRIGVGARLPEGGVFLNGIQRRGKALRSSQPQNDMKQTDKRRKQERKHSGKPPFLFWTCRTVRHHGFDAKIIVRSCLCTEGTLSVYAATDCPVHRKAGILHCGYRHGST